MIARTVLMDYTINTKVNLGDASRAHPAVLVKHRSVLCSCVACVLWRTMRYMDGQTRTDVYFFFCSGFLTSGALVATGAGVGLAAATGALVLLVLGLDIVNRLWAVGEVGEMATQMAEKKLRREVVRNRVRMTCKQSEMQQQY